MDEREIFAQYRLENHKGFVAVPLTLIQPIGGFRWEDLHLRPNCVDMHLRNQAVAGMSLHSNSTTRKPNTPIVLL